MEEKFINQQIMDILLMNTNPYQVNLLAFIKNQTQKFFMLRANIRFYEIRPDSTVIIKSVPIPIELFEYYPLSIGNYWIYKVTDWSYPYYSEDTFTRRVVSKEILSNNKEYFKIEEKYITLHTQIMFMKELIQQKDLFIGLIMNARIQTVKK